MLLDYLTNTIWTAWMDSNGWYGEEGRIAGESGGGAGCKRDMWFQRECCFVYARVNPQVEGKYIFDESWQSYRHKGYTSRLFFVIRLLRASHPPLFCFTRFINIVDHQFFFLKNKKKKRTYFHPLERNQPNL